MAKFWSKFLVWNIVRTYVLSSSSSSTWNISGAFAECWHIGPKFEDLKEMILKWPRIHFISRRKLKYQSACKAIREREKVPALTCQCTVMNGCHCITFFFKAKFYMLHYCQLNFKIQCYMDIYMYLVRISDAFSLGHFINNFWLFYVFKWIHIQTYYDAVWLVRRKKSVLGFFPCIIFAKKLY